MNTEKNVIIKNNVKSKQPVVTKTTYKANSQPKSGDTVKIKPGQNVEIKKPGLNVGIKFPEAPKPKPKPQAGARAVKPSYQPAPLREMPRPMGDRNHSRNAGDQNDDDVGTKNLWPDNADDQNLEPESAESQNIASGNVGAQNFGPETEESEDELADQLRIIQSQVRTGNEVSGETEEGEEGEEPDEAETSDKMRQKKKKAIKKSGSEAGAEAGMANKAQDKIKELIKQCWMNAPASFGLTLFGVQLNMFCRSAISESFFPELGSEWFPSVIQDRSPEAIEFATKKIKLAEILVLLLYDFIFAIVVGTALVFIIFIARFYLSSWFEKLKIIWENIGILKDALSAFF